MKKIVFAGVLCIIIVSLNLSLGYIYANDHTYFCISSSHGSAQWTVMYYMCCDSNMDEDSKPLIENLSRIKSTSSLNIVLVNDQKEPGDTQLIYIDKDGELVELNQQLGWPNEVDTSNPHTLELFCKDMMILFPAEHYALITYASGGTGWQIYCLHDESDGTVGISLPVLEGVFSNITPQGTQKIDVFMVSCAMGTIELSYQLSPYANYIIGTQDCFEKRDLVHRFYAPVEDLHNNTYMNPEQFASCSPTRLDPHSFYYRESYYGYLPFLNQILNNLPFTGLHCAMHFPSSSVINLSHIEKLAVALDNLTVFLLANLNNGDVREDVWYARENVRESGKCYPKIRLFGLGMIHGWYAFECLSYDCFIDLYHFVELLSHQTDNVILKNLCASVMEKSNETIPLIKSILDKDHGLNIYFPKTRYMYDKYIFRGRLPCHYEYLRFSQDTQWDEFIRTFIEVN